MPFEYSPTTHFGNTGRLKIVLIHGWRTSCCGYWKLSSTRRRPRTQMRRTAEHLECERCQVCLRKSIRQHSSSILSDTNKAGSGHDYITICLYGKGGFDQILKETELVLIVGNLQYDIPSYGSCSGSAGNVAALTNSFWKSSSDSVSRARTESCLITCFLRELTQVYFISYI